MNTIIKRLVTTSVATLVFLSIQSGITFAQEQDENKLEISNEGNSDIQNDIPFSAIENPDKPINEGILKETPGYKISSKEKDLLARLVEAEAKGESFEGKVAVATVVLNRVDSNQFPNSITNVIYEKVGNAYAFSPVQNGEINKQASEEATQAVEEALKSPDRLNNALYFYNPEIATDDWIRSRQIVKKIGNHVFAI
ncbi:hypothetical protein J27TS8_17940 [Robertmurraya siralis]|uniref:Cell wall hydrolase SleB domain-containing protein n=1 Tax=Robertmurraya siralis TaxID=77777 RepID=A0A919WHH5_9BACI|nr:cell wall hydrolase [Robertmurraya siralis]PAE18454.1 hypothetical protein CHH80_21710 [Bacillus sp. 7504-2]GIN61801.1 hypothetical protein J27TS8_17940 [Robertmurraya siralis]